jgi:hypothetical protein
MEKLSGQRRSQRQTYKLSQSYTAIEHSSSCGSSHVNGIVLQIGAKTTRERKIDRGRATAAGGSPPLVALVNALADRFQLAKEVLRGAQTKECFRHAGA